MGKGKDKVQRNRRKKTDEEKAALLKRKEADRKQKEADRRAEAKNDRNSVASYFARAAVPEEVCDDSSEEDSAEDLDDETTAARVEEDDGAVLFTDEVDAGCDEDDPNIAANLDVDEDELNDDLDEGAEAEPANEPARKWKHGVHQDYMRALHDRLKIEVASNTKGLETQWLLTHLKENGGWIRKEQAERMIQHLRSSKKSPRTYSEVKIKWQKQNKPYYRDVYVYIPDILGLGACRPCCPSCKSDRAVSRHGFNANHIGRLVVGLTENYYVLTCRYICTSCQERRRNQVRAVVDAVNAGVEVPSSEKLKYTFMGWDPESTPLTAYGCGDEFPAVLTSRAALDKQLIDLMRPEFDKGTRPEAFSNMVLELHAKNYTRAWLRYEREYAFEKKENENGFAVREPWSEFSDFNDETKWNDKVPTGAYFAKAYKTFSKTLLCHYNKEVKKRGARVLSHDVSYKEANNLYQYKGKSIFNGLVTATNEHGEVRIQHHVVSDSKEQHKPALDAFKQTATEYGLPLPELVHTDDPSRDYNFFMTTFESLREQNEKFNSHTSNANPEVEHPQYFFDHATPFLKIVSTKEQIRLAVASMTSVMNHKKGLALDCEWKVEFNGRGMRTEESKIGLIQFAYCNKNENDRIQVLLIRTHKIKKLPGSLIALLAGSAIPLVGVNIGGDLARIGKDFGISDRIKQRNKSSIVNLGLYARKRDIIQNGTIGLKELTKIVLGLTIDKNEEDRFSDWNADELSTRQITYAAIDVDAPLKIFVELLKKPDLTIRLGVNDATVGKRVDIVPRFGGVACMATRAATGKIVDASYCDSPEGISQSRVKVGPGMVTVMLETIYSPSLEVPHYRKTDKKGKPTLGEFGLRQIVLPIQMLKDHVEVDSVRVYQSDDRSSASSRTQQAGITPPATDSTNTTADELNTSSSNNVSRRSTTRLQEGDSASNSYPTDDEIVEMMMNLTSSDIEMLRATTIEGELTSTGRLPLQCEWLSQPPSPDEIQDVYSPLLGDIFHAMQRPYVPTKHEAKKGYYVALQNAFFVWNESQMEDLVSRMNAAGVTGDEIEKMKYYNSRFFINCIEREVPPPSVLYWRVRAVFALYGPMKDSVTGKPMFNAKAWKKANGILREIRKGYYSDPPGMGMYKKILCKDGTVKRNKYGLDMIECIRGTNRTEAYHKNLIVTFRSWHTGVEMSDCLLAERRHRHNHNCSERRRFGFPKLGHYDTWLVDQLQVLVLDNRNRVLYPSWSNASEYRETSESFGTVAVHNSELDAALKEVWNTQIDQTVVKLTSDQKHMCVQMGTDLPFLPFTTVEENELFADCALRNDFPIDNDNDAAIAWCKFVDGVNIFPKLPVHIRLHRESFERNQRVRACVERAKSGQDKLDELNNALKPSTAANRQPASLPETMPVIHPNAMHNLPFVTTGGTAVGSLPSPSKKRRVGERGKDKMQRKTKRCSRCRDYGGVDPYECPGRGKKELCIYYEQNGVAKVLD